MKKEEKRWAAGMLFMGTILSIIGNLVANSLDKYFSHFGIGYNIFVGFLFIIILFWLEKEFRKIIGK